MQVSAELRWFWRDEPTAVNEWFGNSAIHGQVAAGGGKDPRIDEYLSDPGEGELGIKLRGGKDGVEIKGLVQACANRLQVGPFCGPMEIWTKWTHQTLALNPSSLIKTQKLRWVRKFDTTGSSCKEIALDQSEKPTPDRELPKRGCNVELTRIRIAHEDWWTFAFEAFAELSNVVDSLRDVAQVLADRDPPTLPQGLVASYPKWLRTVTASSTFERSPR